MLELAVSCRPALTVDSRELNRHGPSYTIDTLCSLRQELGPDTSLAWVIGVDAASTLDGWHAWRRLPELAHLLLLERPGWSLPTGGPIAEMLKACLTDDVADLHSAPAGRAWWVGQPPLAVSSSEVRATLLERRSAAHLLPVPVWAYIKQRELYGYHGVPGHEAESE